MKKNYLTLVLLFVASLSFASNNELFDLNYDQLNQEFAQLDQLAVKVKSENLTFNDLMTTDASLLKNIALSSTPSVPLASEDPLGIPSFLWGCVLGPIGIVIAYLTSDNDKQEAKKALWGCLAQTAVVLVVQLLLIGGTAAAASSSY